MDYCTISKAAETLGFKSRSTLYSFIDKGYLDEFLYVNAKGRRFLKMEGLKEFLIANTVPPLLNQTINK